MTHRAFFVASLAWNLGLGMTWLAVPLYAASQGLTNSEVGALVALPVIFQVAMNLVGGAYTDRIGGRRIMLGSCWAMALAAVWLIFAQGFWMLMIGQVGLILSRAAFWPATWAMASELPGDRGVQLGLLNAVTNAGQIGGTVLCGLLLSAAGFGPTFAVLALVSAAAYVAGLGTTPTPPKPVAGQRHVLALYLPLLRNRIVHYSILCAYLSALPFSLSLSFYPLLLAQFGYSEDASGVLLALRAIGAIAAGLIAGRFVRTGPETLWPVVCGVSVAVGVALLPVTNHVVPIGFWLFVVGLGSGAMTLYFQITIAEASETGARGSALALGGLGWSISHLTTPLLMGFLADRYSIVVAFYVVGAMALLTAVLIAWMRRWAFRKPAGVKPL